MINKPKISHLTLFTTALCNLNCSYCYICKDKKGGLKKIDNDIDDMFKNNKQIEQILDYDPDIKSNLESITLWGGEPFLKIDRFINNMEKYFDTFPNLCKLDVSTNFTLDNEINSLEQIFQKIKKLYHIKNKPFHFGLQISIDGYEEMNDSGRGEGVTKRILNNFYKLLNLSYDSDLIQLNVFLKPTLSRNTFHFLDTPEKCKKWFYFFENNMYKQYDEKKPPFNFSLSLFNCAQPSEYTTEDGIYYYQIEKNIQLVEDEILEECKGWSKDYLSLIPESYPTLSVLKNEFKSNFEECKESYKCKRCGGGCGSFVYNIVPITNNMFTMCHRGVFDGYTDYYNNVHSLDNMHDLAKSYFKADNVKDWLYTKEQLKNISNSIMKLYTHENNIFYTDLLYMIRDYAKAGIIDEKYINIKEIEPTLGYFLNNSFCLQDGYIETGSWITRAPNEIPLLYNGAMDIIMEEINKNSKKGFELDI